MTTKPLAPAGPSPHAPRWSSEARSALVRADHAHVWHPYTAADLWENEDPLVVVHAEGSTLFDADGTRYLDGNASWWTKTLGHGHPRLREALLRQAKAVDHVAFAGITHEPAARLAEELVAIAPPGLTRVFFTDNGSGAIEVAVKMAVQSFRQRGKPEKCRFLALDGAYHGDTIGAASLGGVEIFRRPFAGVLFECFHAKTDDPRGLEAVFSALETQLRSHAGQIAAVFVEPLLQGAEGMRIYSPELLRRLRALCTELDVLLVCDEVFTGYGRTGPMWACETAGIVPDLMCLGKAFSQILPMGATMATETLYDAFRGTKDRALLYGHTFAGNPLGAALAREVLAIYRDDDVLGQVARKAPRIRETMHELGKLDGVSNPRALGMMGALDLAGPASPFEGEASDYLGAAGWRVYREARARGAYLRPLGATVYVCPPLVIDEADLERLLSIFGDSVRAALASR